MKNFIPIDNTLDKALEVTDFLDSLDTDIASSDIDNISTDECSNISEDDSLVTEEKQEEITALVVQKPNSLFVAQTMFKKSIKISIKSFLISLSLGFLNLFL